METILIYVLIKGNIYFAKTTKGFALSLHYTLLLHIHLDSKDILWQDIYYGKVTSKKRYKKKKKRYSCMDTSNIT